MFYFEISISICSSVVPKSGLIPFNPKREPYKSYSTRLKNFLTDAGIRRATNFHNTGKIPKMFKWLILGETGYLDPMDSEDSLEEGGGIEDVIDPEVSDDEQKLQKSVPVTTKVLKSTNGNKRGRKPKNPLNPVMMASTVLMSPKPVNPSDSFKIESLIINNSNTTNSQETIGATV